jgi:2-keto-4-pentenoate hydratase/2-oxohepta-3-ene-1,7-dioic acid hydratase in catechol pathway
MKLLRYGPVGSEKPGLLDAGGQLRDLSAHIPDLGPACLGAAGLTALASLDPARLPPVAAGVRIGCPIAGIGKVIAVGLNYAQHAQETGLALPDEPILFMKATSAICGPDDDVIIPRDALKTDWEVELGVIIGTTARYVDEADALRHVAGYVVVNDISERSYQFERGGQWDKGKSCDTFCPVGPWLVTADEIGDVPRRPIWLEVNGQRRQDSYTGDLIFGIAQLVSYISRFMTLQPGDLISTGTPPGVGFMQKPEPIFLKAGDVMRLGIDGLGVQTQTCRAWAPDY